MNVLTSVAVVVVDGLLPDPVVCAGDCKLTAESGGTRNVRVVNHSVDNDVEEPDKVSRHGRFTVAQLAEGKKKKILSILLLLVQLAIEK